MKNLFKAAAVVAIMITAGVFKQPGTIQTENH